MRTASGSAGLPVFVLDIISLNDLPSKAELSGSGGPRPFAHLQQSTARVLASPAVSVSEQSELGTCAASCLEPEYPPSPLHSGAGLLL